MSKTLTEVVAKARPAPAPEAAPPAAPEAQYESISYEEFAVAAEALRTKNRGDSFGRVAFYRGPGLVQMWRMTPEGEIPTMMRLPQSIRVEVIDPSTVDREREE